MTDALNTANYLLLLQVEWKVAQNFLFIDLLSCKKSKILFTIAK